jgi:hypothetical protein
MEEQTFNIHEAFKILKRHYITDNIQTVSRFIREKRLHGVRGKRKDGWIIKESDLYEFIDEEKPGIVEMVYVYDKYAEGILVPSSETFLKGKKRIAAAEKNLDDVLNKIHDDLNRLNQQIEQITKTSKEKSTFGSNTVEPPRDKSPSDIPKKKINKYKKVILKKFKDLLIKKEILKKDDVASLEIEIRIIYRVYFDDEGHMREKVFNENGYICPVTKEEMKVFVPLLKKTISQLLKKIKDKELVWKQDGTVGAPDDQTEKKEDINSSSQNELDEVEKGKNVGLDEEIVE